MKHEGFFELVFELVKSQNKKYFKLLKSTIRNMKGTTQKS